MLLRLYNPGDEEAIIDLLKLVFNGWPHFDLPVSALDHWKWKYLDNPSKSIVAVACDGEKIVSCQHTIMKKIKVGNNIYNSGIGADVVNHPDYRGMGIYAKLRNFKEENEKKYQLSFRNYIQNHPKLIAGDKKLGNPSFVHKAFESYRIKKPINYFNIKNDYKSLIGYVGLSGLNYISNIFKTKKDVNEIEIRSIDNFDDRYVLFWNEIKNYYKFIFVRDKTYLNWRYGDKRAGNYKIYEAESNGELIGYIILRINNWNIDDRMGMIVDLMVKPGHFECMGALIDEALDYFDSKNVPIIKSWNISSPLFDYYSTRGFIVKPSGLNLTFTKSTVLNNDDYKMLLESDSKETHYSMGDQDHI